MLCIATLWQGQTLLRVFGVITMSEATKKEIEQKYAIGKKGFRAKETSIYMGIGLSTVWLYAKQGMLTPMKISKRVTIFNKDEIDALLNGSKAVA